MRPSGPFTASLALLASCLGIWACGGAGDGDRSAVALDFRPNAVHSGLYAGLADDPDVEIVEPSSSSDAPKLLEAGRVDLAILDITDLGVARSRGLDLVGIAAITQAPLASVLVRGSRDGSLKGTTVGVTGLPSDDLVLDTVLRGQGLTASDVKRVTVGFGAVPALRAGRLDAATAYWNAEGVELRRAGVPIEELRVERLGAPRFPQLVLAARRTELRRQPARACATLRQVEAGYRRLDARPYRALGALLASVPDLKPESQRAQMDALLRGRAFSSDPEGNGASPLLTSRGDEWIAWARSGGLLSTAEANRARGLLDPDFATRCARPRQG